MNGKIKDWKLLNMLIKIIDENKKQIAIINKGDIDLCIGDTMAKKNKKYKVIEIIKNLIYVEKINES